MHFPPLFEDSVVWRILAKTASQVGNTIWDAASASFLMVRLPGLLVHVISGFVRGPPRTSRRGSTRLRKSAPSKSSDTMILARVAWETQFPPSPYPKTAIPAHPGRGRSPGRRHSPPREFQRVANRREALAA